MIIIPNIELNNNTGYSILNILDIFKYFEDESITNIPEITTRNFINVDNASMEYPLPKRRVSLKLNRLKFKTKIIINDNIERL